MTVILTRYFEGVDRAQAARQELVSMQRLSPKIISMFDKADGLAEELRSAHVDEGAIDAYSKRMAKGGAVLLVRAGYKPLGVAQITRDVTRQFGAADLGDIVEEVRVKEEPNYGLNVLTDHPHFLTRPIDGSSLGPHMADWPIPLISRRKPFNDMSFPPHARMANVFLPLTIRREPYTGSAIAPHARMADFPIPLLSKRKPYTGSIIAPHARMANFPIPLISRRKPKNRSIFPRHQRMANWPFPLLINGETGTNSLIPGGPRMANFPIPLLSKRKPFTGSMIGRHARMARFPIPLISHRKPYTGSAISRHGRMADFPWPLVISRENTAADDGGTGFSFSKLLNMPTIIRR